MRSDTLYQFPMAKTIIGVCEVDVVCRVAVSVLMHVCNHNPRRAFEESLLQMRKEKIIPDSNALLIACRALQHTRRSSARRPPH